MKEERDRGKEERDRIARTRGDGAFLNFGFLGDVRSKRPFQTRQVRLVAFAGGGGEGGLELAVAGRGCLWRKEMGNQSMLHRRTSLALHPLESFHSPPATYRQSWQREAKAWVLCAPCPNHAVDYPTLYLLGTFAASHRPSLTLVVLDPPCKGSTDQAAGAGSQALVHRPILVDNLGIACSWPGRGLLLASGVYVWAECGSMGSWPWL